MLVLRHMEIAVMAFAVRSPISASELSVNDPSPCADFQAATLKN